MPIQLIINRNKACVFSKAVGDLVDEDLLTHHRRLKSHPCFRDHYDQVIDFTNHGKVEFSPETIYNLAQDNPFSHGSRRAIVARSPAVYGLARMYQAHVASSPDVVEVFRTMTAANRWLERVSA